MNRKDFFFRQKLTEAELDSAFDEAEIADRNIMVDLGFVGVITNGVVTEESPTPNLTVDVSGPMTGRTPLGERLFFGSTLNVDLSKDGNLPVGSGGTGDGVTTAVGSGGQEKWVSVFMIADRILSDPRTDGLGATVNFVRTESFHFVIVQSAEFAAPIGIGNAPTTPAGTIRLADVRFTFGMTQIFNAAIDVTNRDIATLLASMAASSVTVNDNFPNLSTSVTNVQETFEAHIAQVEDAHGPAQTISDKLLLGRTGAPTALFPLEVDLDNTGPEQIFLHDKSSEIFAGFGGKGMRLSSITGAFLGRFSTDVIDLDLAMWSFGAIPPALPNQPASGIIQARGIFSHGSLAVGDGLEPTKLLLTPKDTIPSLVKGVAEFYTGLVAGKVFDVDIKAGTFEPVEDHQNITLSAAQLTQLGRGRMVMAACRFDGGTGNLIGTTDVNIASVARTGLGAYTITFDQQLTSGFIVSATIGESSGGIIGVVARTNTQVLLKTWSRAAVEQDRDIDLTIIGKE